MGSIGMPELLIILVVVMLIFGGKKIPELMGGLGKGVRSFKKGLNNPDEEELGDLEAKAARAEAARKKIEEAQKAEAAARLESKSEEKQA